MLETFRTLSALQHICIALPADVTLEIQFEHRFDDRGQFEGTDIIVHCKGFEAIHDIYKLRRPFFCDALTRRAILLDFTLLLRNFIDSALQVCELFNPLTLPLGAIIVIADDVDAVKYKRFGAIGQRKASIIYERQKRHFVFVLWFFRERTRIDSCA